ncbi:hypothetical protein C2G38_2027170 [Gigaspora rosea]|uniref:Uncharacterized protein n=1 Tax=Gigaspora rosea TaxID=44941 RepID=A0A397W9C7_9GLOM|nr:hypothetical protein C2G38_2027170 [Gigaspora rosea]
MLHTWEVCGCAIQAPCRGSFKCPALTEYNGLSKKIAENNDPRFICTNCFEEHRGHLQIQPGINRAPVWCFEKGLHDDDTKLALKFFGKWIDQTAESENEAAKINLLKELVKLLNNINMNNTNILDTQDTNTVPSTASVPSLFLVKTAFAIKKIKVNEEQILPLNTTTCETFGRMLANSVLQERAVLKKRLQSLEEPGSLEEYYNAMPSLLISFFTGLISAIEEKKMQVLARKRKERNMPPSHLNKKKIILPSLFFVSVILTTAFRNWKIWFTHVLSSLC